MKLHDKNLEVKQNDMYSVPGNVMYMLSFEKFVDENPVCDENDDDNNAKNEEMSFKTTSSDNASSVF